MAKIDRLERLDLRRIDLEANYRAALVEALERCASGKWGLFDHKGDRWTRAAFESEVRMLNDIGESVDGLRRQLGMEAFDLHQEFLTSRGPVVSNAVGEPKQAKAWLARLAADDR